MFKLYQIHLTTAEIGIVNDAESLAQSERVLFKWNAMCDARFGDPVGRAFYTHVADVDSNDLEEAFTIGNIGPEERLTRHREMHSISVGDVLVNEAGEAFFVKPCGFEQLANF